MKHKLLLWMMFCLPAIALAQQQKVSGKVTDAADGLGLPGVNIIEAGTSNGTVTDVDGNFTLEVGTEATLIFSYVGYTTKEVPVASRTVVDVQLEADITQLAEVVVVGYGSQKKGDVTGVVAKIDDKSFNKGAIVSPEQLIVGKVAGVQITPNSGEPGGEVTIKIRGGSNLDFGSSSDPLYVIDGVPINNDGFAGGRNPLNFLNPNDIESFTVLKDASAAAIYGARASNGVIIITTKNGHKGSPKLSYNGYVSMATVADKMEVLNAQQFRDVITAKAPGKLSLLGAADTDWQDAVLQQAFGQSHSLSYSGGTDKSLYRASLNYMEQEGVIKTSKTQRTIMNLSYSNKLLDDKLLVKINFKGAQTRDRYDASGIGGAFSMAPTQPIYDEDSPWGGYWEWDNDLGTKNPVAQNNLTNHGGQSFRGLGNIQFDYKFDDLVKGLSANLNLATDVISAERKFFQPSYLRGQYQNNGEIQIENTIRSNPLLEFYLNYKRDLSSISSTVDVTAGYSYQDFDSENTLSVGRQLTTDVYGFNNPSVATEFDVDRWINESRLISFFGRMNYAFMDKYLLTVNVRRDGSSRFGKSNRWGLFPSAALGWRIYDEDFMDGFKDVLSDLKFRVSYGLVGNQEIGNYLYLPTYTQGGTFARYQFGDQFVSTLRPNGVDPNIKWEETASLNAGVDFGFFRGRLSGSLNYYHQTTSDLLFTVNVPAGTNLSNRILTNIAELENTGFELALNAVAINENDFRWDLGITASTNKNKILKLDGSDTPDFKGYETGFISGGVGNTIQILKVGESTNTFRVYQHKLDAEGKPLVDGVDYNEDGEVNEADMYVDVNNDDIVNDEDRRAYKSARPKLMLGLTSNMTYKGFDFSFTLRSNMGGYAYNNVASNAGYYNRVITEIVPQNMPLSVVETNFSEPQFFSDYYVEKADFLRMDNVTLGYTFKPSSNKLSVRVYGTAQNLFLLTNYSGLDPEIPSGIDNNLYPRSRTFLAGVNITF